MNVRRISFEVTDSYEIEGFRNFIKLLLSEDDKYDVFIISNHDTTSEVITIANNLGIESDHIVMCNFAADKAQAVDDNDIDIHFDNLQSFILLVDETTEAHGILVTPYLNKYELRPDYVIVFERILKQLDNEENC